jgi:tight adherence protein C
MIFTEEYFPILISVSLFLSIALIYIGLLSYLKMRKKSRGLIARSRQAEYKSVAPLKAQLSAKNQNKLLIWFSNLIASLGKRVAPKNPENYSLMRLKFLKAGIRRENASAIFWGFKVILAVFLPLCIWSLPLPAIKLLSLPLIIGLCVNFAIMGFFLPEIWLRVKTARRKEKLMRGFPDALDLLVVCVEAGMGMDASINRVAREIRLSNKELSDEFRLMSLELRAGKSRRDALKNLALRTNIEDVNSLATLLIQTDRFGGNIAQALRVYSDTFRTKRYQRAEEKAAKVPVKLVFPLILFILPSLFVAIAGSAAVQLYRTLMHH